MKKDRKYIFYLGAALLLYLVVTMTAPRELDWRVTYHSEDKIPFGAFALHEILPDIFPDKQISQNYYTIYEAFDTLHAPVNFLSVSSTFNPGPEDTKALLKNIALGGSAFIAAENFYGTFADTLEMQSNDYFYEDDFRYLNSSEDSTKLMFSNPEVNKQDTFRYPRKNIHAYLTFLKSSRPKNVIAANDLGLTVTAKIPWGKGIIYVNATPLAFTNIYLLDKENYSFVTTSLSHMPVRDVIWTEYYHMGRMESETPLRFILSNEPLRWAYYLTIGTLIIFILFEIKRKQRIIPVIKPVENTTLEFVTTIGDLYFQTGEHKNIAEKKISYFLEHIRVKYWLTPKKFDDSFINALTKKSGRSETDIRALVTSIQIIQSTAAIHAHQLVDLNRKLEIFYGVTPGDVRTKN